MTEESVVRELAGIRDRIDRMDAKLDRVRTEDLPGIRIYVAGELAALRVKAGLWGAVGAAIPAIVVLVVVLLHRL